MQNDESTEQQKTCSLGSGGILGPFARTEKQMWRSWISYIFSSSSLFQFRNLSGTSVYAPFSQMGSWKLPNINAMYISSWERSTLEIATLLLTRWHSRPRRIVRSTCIRSLPTPTPSYSSVSVSCACFLLRVNGLCKPPEYETRTVKPSKMHYDVQMGKRFLLRVNDLCKPPEYKTGLVKASNMRSGKQLMRDYRLAPAADPRLKTPCRQDKAKRG